MSVLTCTHDPRVGSEPHVISGLNLKIRIELEKILLKVKNRLLSIRKDKTRHDVSRLKETRKDFLPSGVSSFPPNSLDRIKTN